MQKKIKELLLKAAMEGETYTYRYVAQQIGLRYSEKWGGYGEKFFSAMVEIGKEEFLAGRPLLNVLIVNDSDKMPGPGFFLWYKATLKTRRNFRNSSDRIELVKDLQEECFEYWKLQKQIA